MNKAHQGLLHNPTFLYKRDKSIGRTDILNKKVSGPNNEIYCSALRRIRETPGSSQSFGKMPLQVFRLGPDIFLQLITYLSDNHSTFSNLINRS